MAFEIKNGGDGNDPLTQARVGMAAYEDANRAIFMQNNRVVEAYKRALGRLDQPDKTTGKVPLSSQAISTAAKTFFPIVRVPTNIVAETMEYATGAVAGSARLARALRQGVNTLRPEEADLIMRQLKKGSLGGAILLTGFLAHAEIGGYYQAGQKRNKKDVKPGGLKVADTEVAPSFLHNPALEMLQLGATAYRVADSRLRKKDREKQGLSNGALAAAMGLADEVPFVRETTEIAKAFNPAERGAFFGEIAKSILVPQAFQQIAAAQDKDAAGNPIKRKPETIVEHLKTGIPGLRKEVRENPKQ